MHRSTERLIVGLAERNSKSLARGSTEQIRRISGERSSSSFGFLCCVLFFVMLLCLGTRTEMTVPQGVGSTRTLTLDRALSSLHFESWRLGGILAAPEPETVALPRAVYVPEQAATDYVHARHAALHNHLTTQPVGVYLFVDGRDNAVLCSVAQDNAVDPLCGDIASSLPEYAKFLLYLPGDRGQNSCCLAS